MRKGNAAWAVVGMLVGANALAMTTTTEGKLRVSEARQDGGMAYVCTLESNGKTFEVNLGFDPVTARMEAFVDHPVTFVRGRSYHFAGAYSEVVEKNEGLPSKKTYTLIGANDGFRFNLTFTEGSSQPEFTFGNGLASYRCR